LPPKSSGVAWRVLPPSRIPAESEFRLSPEAEAELDGIWIHIARESRSIDIATGVVEGITVTVNPQRAFLAAGPVSVPGASP
jgi:hypothetical protein